MATYINNEMKPIGKFLSDVTLLRVPANQRNYAWTDEDIKQLWQDITEAIDANREEYFLGPMVLQSIDSGYEIIDGQQRIATILIILSIIRRLLNENGDRDRGLILTNKYFGEPDIKTLEKNPKFQMNEENDPVFQKHVSNDSYAETIKNDLKGKLKKNPNYLLLQAIIQLRDLITEQLKLVTGNDYDRNYLLRIEDYLKKNVYVLFLFVTDEADAYVIFETLNDRGKGLSTMDLLKNHVFRTAGKNLSQVKHYWAKVKDNLENVDPRDRFLHHYWTSKYGRTSKHQLYRSMRESIGDATTALAFAEDLVKCSRIYSALSISDHPYWNEHSQTTRDNIRTLGLLDAQQSLPILMAAAQKFDEEEFQKLTDILIVMAVRYNLIGEQRTGVLANHYVSIPAKIEKGLIRKSSKVFNEIRHIYPSNEDFVEAFSIKVIKDSAKARYILSQLEKAGSNETFEIARDPNKVNLEHILPVNSSQEWNDTVRSIESEDLQDYLDRLGNLALVSRIDNKKVGAKNFQLKKELSFSKEKNIKFTKMICEYGTWLKKDIDDRQKRMAEAAVKVWKIEY